MATPTRYERVRFAGRSVILRVTAESEHFMRGIEVNKFGDEVIPRGADERLHIIQKTVIKKRTALKMNNYYAELEEVGC